MPCDIVPIRERRHRTLQTQLTSFSRLHFFLENDQQYTTIYCRHVCTVRVLSSRGSSSNSSLYSSKLLNSTFWIWQATVSWQDYKRDNRLTFVLARACLCVLYCTYSPRQ